MNTRVNISFLLLVLLPLTSFSEEKFDKIRCNGKLIEPGNSLQFVLENCGEPVNRRNWGNQYETQKHLYFKAPGESGCYYTFFIDDKIVVSVYKGYQGCP
ncbi:DUF2845 domain-containing protein [Legionella bononiensis]|uniref:DUF2845 domain-containing protein n=1 Tax=Legionella bononiensis TaxID=2793102 RepID=A0ABS1W8S6_9GAMM|nr:DUF2845 domain-containing protein [Legionella bononiensis]MBL7479719.1 DUF2845 domain-containing protein [Legionella bononiensis]MBL7525768.1 DUF2845 domain-containing protein [Legionella bononiensis]MBL7561950.1 DUF2845 domain-containing protein [Legionella bononiensis]